MLIKLVNERTYISCVSLNNPQNNSSEKSSARIQKRLFEQ